SGRASGALALDRSWCWPCCFAAAQGAGPVARRTCAGVCAGASRGRAPGLVPAVVAPPFSFPSLAISSRLARDARRVAPFGEHPMANYILLANYSEQGLKGIKDTVKRTDAVRDLAKKAGITMKESFWTLGKYDVVALFEAPDDETMTAFSLSIA